MLGIEVVLLVELIPFGVGIKCRYCMRPNTGNLTIPSPYQTYQTASVINVWLFCNNQKARESWERDSHDMRFKRLQHLLQKSNIYSKFLLTKMEQQQNEV